MRFKASILVKSGQPAKIPFTYRKNLLSMIKEALKKDDNPESIYQKYYSEKSKNRQKPFTFSLHVPTTRPDRQGKSDSLILAGNRLSLFFSSCDPVFLIYFYNGLIGLKKSDYPLFPGCKAEIGGFNMVKDKKMDTDNMVFKTCSPFLVRDLKDKKGAGYLSCDHGRFKQNLFYSVENLCRNFIDENYKLLPDQFEFEPVKCKAEPVPLYGGEIGNSGIFRIKAPVEVLQLIYDAGLGAKRSQGFGMLEVLG